MSQTTETTRPVGSCLVVIDNDVYEGQIIDVVPFTRVRIPKMGWVRRCYPESIFRADQLDAAKAYARHGEQQFTQDGKALPLKARALTALARATIASRVEAAKRKQREFEQKCLAMVDESNTPCEVPES